MFLRHREQAHSHRKAKSKDRSLRQLLQLERVPPQEQVGSQAAFASRLASIEKQKQKIAAFGSSYTMSVSSSAFDLAFDPPATSEG